MNKGKFIFSTKIKDYLTARGDQVNFSVYGFKVSTTSNI